MKVRHINSKKEFDLSKPCYVEYYDSCYGYLIAAKNGKILFFYRPNIGGINYEDLTEEFERIKCTACSGSGYYCGKACGACEGKGVELE
jgi:hypothetical protein